MVVQVGEAKSSCSVFYWMPLFILVSLASAKNIIAQKKSFGNDMKYVQYLKENKLYKEANYVLDAMDTSSLLVGQIDSIKYNKGIAYFFLSEPDLSTHYFLCVSKNSQFYPATRIASSYNNWKCKNYNGSEALLNDALAGINDTSLEIRPLAYLMLSANSLLQDSIFKYLSYKKRIITTDQNIINGIAVLDKAYQKKISFRRNSPVMAGVLSALVPGLGKACAGKPFEGLGAFVPVASLGLITLEAYHKGSIKSAAFISSAALFSLFYAGNIWGGIAMVKIRNAGYKDDYEKNITINMRVPIRNLFR